MLRIGTYIQSEKNIIARVPLPGGAQLITFRVHGAEQQRTYLFLGNGSASEAEAAMSAAFEFVPL